MRLLVGALLAIGAGSVAVAAPRKEARAAHGAGGAEKLAAASMQRFARAGAAAPFPPDDYDRHHRPNRSEVVVVRSDPRLLHLYTLDDKEVRGAGAGRPLPSR